jgi:hypothetical protein
MRVPTNSVRLGSKDTGQKVLSKVPSGSSLKPGSSAPKQPNSPLLAAMLTTTPSVPSTPLAPNTPVSGSMMGKSKSLVPSNAGQSKGKLKGF